MNQADFVATYGPLAGDVASATGLHPDMVLGQMALESGWGSSMGRNNPFGISPGGSPATYGSVPEGAQAYVDLVKRRYQGASVGAEPTDQAAIMAGLGYNTVDPAYSAKVGDAAKRVSGLRAAQGQDGAPSADDLLQRMQQLGGQASKQPAEEQAPSADDLLQRIQQVAPSQTAGKPPADTPTTGGMGRNVAAGVLDTAANVGNVLSDPFYNLVAHPLAVAGGTAYDAAAKLFGFPQMTDAQRADLYGQSSGPQIGTRAISALGQAIGGDQMDPAKVTADTTAQQLVRAGVGGAGTMAALGPGGALAPIMGASGAVAGEVAGEAAPNWLKPAAQLAGNIVGGAATVPLALGARAGVNALESGVTRFAEGPSQAPQIATPEGVTLPAQQEAAPGVPGSVGAAASREGTPASVINAQTPAERIAGLEKSVQQTAEERAGPQHVDETPYVADIPQRTLAARDFSQSVNALDQKVAYAKDTEFRDAVDANNKARNEGMVDLLRNDAGDPIILDKAHQARSEVSPNALGVFDGEKPTDASGLLSTVDQLLQGPDGKRAAVRSVLNDVRSSLLDANGNLEELPSQLYGARKNITDLLQKGVKGVGEQADNVRAAKSILTGLLPPLDATITDGAPKFGGYLKQWSDLSQPINQMEFLQKYQTGTRKITDGAGYLQFNKVQKMLDDILQGNKASGVNDAKTLTNEQIQNVINVRNELAAEQLRQRLASVPGSDTFQQLNRPGVLGRGPVGGAVKGLGELGLGLATGGTGNIVYHFGLKPAMEAKRLAGIAKAEAARKAQLLAPSKNYLEPP